MNHPEFRQALLAEHARQIEHDLLRAYARRTRNRPTEPVDIPVALRLCTVHDDAGLARLAELESRRVPDGRFVVAEVNGELVAALPLDGGLPLADPFHATAHIL